LDRTGLRDEVVKRGIVASISVAQVGRYFKQARLAASLQDVAQHDGEEPETFEREAAKVCETYRDAPRKAAVDGTHTVAWMRRRRSKHRTQRPRHARSIGSVAKQEFEYTRHGTTTLTAGLEVVTGEIISPLGGDPHRTQFVDHIARTVSIDPTGEWIFIVDNLNTHASESLVEWVAEQCGIEDSLGKKTFAASCNR